MKWLLYIFSLYILLLSATPCTADEGCTDEICSAATSQNKAGEPDHKPICPCSPFFACSSCHGVIIQEHKIELTAIPVPATIKSFNYVEQLLVNFPPAVWQPPKAV